MDISKEQWEKHWREQKFLYHELNSMYYFLAVHNLKKNSQNKTEYLKNPNPKLICLKHTFMIIHNHLNKQPKFHIMLSFRFNDFSIESLIVELMNERNYRFEADLQVTFFNQLQRLFINEIYKDP